MSALIYRTPDINENLMPFKVMSYRHTQEQHHTLCYYLTNIPFFQNGDHELLCVIKFKLSLDNSITKTLCFVILLLLNQVVSYR